MNRKALVLAIWDVSKILLVIIAFFSMIGISIWILGPFGIVAVTVLIWIGFGIKMFYDERVREIMKNGNYE